MKIKSLSFIICSNLLPWEKYFPRKETKYQFILKYPLQFQRENPSKDLFKNPENKYFLYSFVANCGHSH